MEIERKDNPGDRNSIKKGMRDLFSETAPETDSRKAEMYGLRGHPIISILKCPMEHDYTDFFC